MEEITINLDLDKNGKGKFFLLKEADVVGELVIEKEGTTLKAIGTEVSAQSKGKGYGKQLVHEMANYARKKDLKVIPECSYVKAQFTKYPEIYKDVWLPEGE